MITAFKRWNAARKTTAELHRLSDHTLMDLGIPRGMIHHIARQEARMRHP